MKKLIPVILAALVGLGGLLTLTSEATATMQRHGNFHGKYVVALSTPKKVHPHCRKHYSHRLHKMVRTCGPVHKVVHHKKHHHKKVAPAY